MKSLFNVLAICGSTREQSSNLQLIQAAGRMASGSMKIDLYEGIALLPYFNPDLDKDTPPPAVQKFRNSISHADGVLICSPEYVFSLPGSLKNALEWTISTTLFAGKPTAFITASALGEQAHSSLRLILKTMDARFSDKTQLHISGIRSKLDANGNITDPGVEADLRQLVSAFGETMSS